jgi:uncharacterized protein (TIGR04255 family)
MENYRNPPITEALFEIQVELPRDASIDRLDAFATKYASRFPKKKPRRRFEGKFEVRDGAAAASETIDLGVDGYLCWSADDKDVVQFRLDGFCYSRLKPYSGWDSAFPETIKYWDEFKKEFRPISIRRTAVRFINTIEIPESKFELSDYFLSSAQIPEMPGAEIENFLTQAIFQLPERSCRAVLIQTIGNRSKNPLMTPIILDLEVATETNTAPGSVDIEKIFLNLRAVKNEIFEKSVTDKARELFK